MAATIHSQTKAKYKHSHCHAGEKIKRDQFPCNFLTTTIQTTMEKNIKIAIKLAYKMVSAMEELSQHWSSLPAEQFDALNEIMQVGFPFDDCLEDTLIRAKSWIANAENAANEPRYTKTVFSIDGEGAFIGMYDPSENWNGWARPYFTREETKRILEELRENEDIIKWEILQSNAVLVYDNPAIHDTDGKPSIWIGEEINGKIYFPIGAGAWTWVPEDDKTFFHKDHSGRDMHYHTTLIDIVIDPDNKDEFDITHRDDRENTLIGWAMNANVGDTYSDNASEWTRTA